METRFELKQEGTWIPEKMVSGFQVTKYDDTLFINTPEGWITVNLTRKTFAVGDYEG